MPKLTNKRRKEGAFWNETEMEKLCFPKSLGHDLNPSIGTVQKSQASPLFFFFLKGPDFVVISKSGLEQEFSRLSVLKMGEKAANVCFFTHF